MPSELSVVINFPSREEWGLRRRLDLATSALAHCITEMEVSECFEGSEVLAAARSALAKSSQEDC